MVATPLFMAPRKQTALSWGYWLLVTRDYFLLTKGRIGLPWRGCLVEKSLSLGTDDFYCLGGLNASAATGVAATASPPTGLTAPIETFSIVANSPD
jgi:hypothetical protein